MSRSLVIAGVVAAVAIVGVPGARPCGASTEPSRVAIYLVRGEHVAPVRRAVPATRRPAAAALVSLLAGPTPLERRQGYTTAVPAGVRLLGLSIARGVATVDLTRRFATGGGSLSMLLRTAQVVHTATRFPGVARVRFLIDGRAIEAIGGEGVVVAPSVDRSAFEGQTPRILVEQPLPGDRISVPFVVRGTANVFEQQFEVDVVTPAGTLLARRRVLAGRDAGDRGSFEIRIPLRSPPSRLVVVAYDRSAKDGAPTDVVRIPVALAR